MLGRGGGHISLTSDQFADFYFLSDGFSSSFTLVRPSSTVSVRLRGEHTKVRVSGVWVPPPQPRVGFWCSSRFWFWCCRSSVLAAAWLLCWTPLTEEPHHVEEMKVSEGFSPGAAASLPLLFYDESVF